MYVRYQFDMVDVYDRVTGRNDERNTLEMRVAELGVAEAEQKSAGIDGDFKLRERVRMAKPLFWTTRSRSLIFNWWSLEYV